MLCLLIRLAQAQDVEGAQLVLYDVELNRQGVGTVALARLRDGRVAARVEDLRAWRIAPSSVPIRILGDDYHILDDLPGFAFELDSARQSLKLQIAPEAFGVTQIGPERRARAAPALPNWGGFLNYDFFSTATRGTTSVPARVDGVIELGAFGPHGAGTTGLLAQNLSRSAPPGQQALRRLIRLDTVWRTDWPEDMRSLQLGDSIGMSGIWGRPVRFAGFNLGRNFATQPGFIALPQPPVAGQSALPSTVEVYLDGVLRQRTNVPPGPFELLNLPTITGRGEMRVVVRDLLGREQVVVQPYLTSPSLLKTGLTDYGFEAGWIREDFGIRSFRYGRAFGAATWREGLSDTLTREVRAELLRGQATAGGGYVWAAPTGHLLTASGAASVRDRRSGATMILGVQQSGFRSIGFGAQGQWSSRHFAQLGAGEAVVPPPRQVLSSSVSIPVAEGAYVSMGYVRLLSRSAESQEALSATFSTRIGARSYLSVNALASLRGPSNRTIGITFVMPLDDGSSLSATQTRAQGTVQTQAQWQKNPPLGEGFGYRARGLESPTADRGEAGMTWNTRIGTFAADVSKARTDTAWRANWTGSVGFVEGDWYAARRFGEAFGVAEVPGFEGVGVLAYNQLVGRTDAAGRVPLPRLLPYAENVIGFDMADLPLDTDVGSAEIVVVPWWGSGVVVRFPVRKSLAAMLTVLRESGEPIPAGGLVRLVETGEEFPVGLRGEVYVSGLSERNTLEVLTVKSCRFTFELPKEAGPQPRLGPYFCQEAER